MPWVGENYGNGLFKKKILVLGESHYCRKHCSDCGDVKIEDNECAEFTNKTIKDLLGYKGRIVEHAYWMNTFTRFTNVLLGEKVDNKTYIDLWNSVIFYNYIQRAMNGPRQSPIEEDFMEGRTAFFEVLRQYKPNLVIVWGERLWDRLPEKGGKLGRQILDGKNGGFYDYSIDGEIISAYSIYHPSSFAFGYKYTEYLREAIRLA